MLSTVLALVMQLLIINSVMAQAPNTSLAYDPNTTRIVDLKNHTITIIDKKTDQPVSICKFTPLETANMTTNIGNVTTCENLTPVKPPINETLTNTGNTTTNETLTANTGNATPEINLTDKFETLQGK